MSTTLHYQSDRLAFIVHSQGASLHALEWMGEPLLFPFDSETERLHWAAGAVLFPFPGRLAGNEMHTAQQTFQWPVNNADSASALHGLSPQWNFDLAYTAHGIRATYSYDGTLDYYPFPCEVQVDYSIEKDALVLEFSVKNTGHATLPFHWGWHPYWQLSDRWAFQGQLEQQMETNSLKQLLDPAPFVGLNWDTEVDRAFFVWGDVHLLDARFQLTQHYQSPAWVQLFRPAGKPWLAIEPMSGLGHSASPWLEVLPGEQRTEKVTISLEN